MVGNISGAERHRYKAGTDAVDTASLVSLNRNRVKPLWISWQHTTRNKSMSRVVGAELLELVTPKRGLARYIELSRKTVPLIWNSHGPVLFIMNPSIVLAVLALIVCTLRGKKLVVDTHNFAIEPDSRFGFLVKPLARMIIRLADIVIVSNETLAIKARGMGGTAIAMPDPLPTGLDVTPEEAARSDSRFTILCVASWAPDEPLTEVIEAARQLETQGVSVNIQITGKYQRAGLSPADMPGNVELTGFVSDHQFEVLLHQADLVMDLTKRDNCLVCGGYEAIAAGKPVMLSDTAVNREVFPRGAVYTRNDAAAIAEAVMLAERELAELRDEVKMQAYIMTQREYFYVNTINQVIYALTGTEVTTDLHLASPAPAARPQIAQAA